MGRRITAAKTTLHIAYGHTSHGSQITNGMKGLVSFKGKDYEWNNGGTGGALDLHDYAMPGDLGSPNRTRWEAETRTLSPLVTKFLSPATRGYLASYGRSVIPVLQSCK